MSCRAPTTKNNNTKKVRRNDALVRHKCSQLRKSQQRNFFRNLKSVRSLKLFRIFQIQLSVWSHSSPLVHPMPCPIVFLVFVNWSHKSAQVIVFLRFVVFKSEGGLWLQQRECRCCADTSYLSIVLQTRPCLSTLTCLKTTRKTWTRYYISCFIIGYLIVHQI